MSFAPFSLLGQALGGLVGASTEDVDDKQKQLQDAIKSGALQASAQYGKQADNLNAQAQGIEQQHVGFDPTKIDADSARLAAVSQHYLSQFQNGGLQGQAAVQAAQASRGLNAQGGIAGIRSDTLHSGAAQEQIGQTAQNEISQAGGAVNALDAQKAAIALQKAAFAGQVTHANLVKNMNAQNAQFNLANSQAVLNNEAQSSLNDVSNNAAEIAIAQQQAEARVGSAALQSLLGAGGSLAAGGVALSNLNTGDTAATSNTYTPLTAAVVPSTTGTGAGYIQPAASMGRSAVAYNPLFNTQPTLPTTADYFNRGST